MEPKREKQLSVTNFIFCGDEFLFLERHAAASINAGELNGVGGKVNSEEDFISAVIRETKEETGYDITPADIEFCGFIMFEGGYKKDWVNPFFRTQVSHKNIPLGVETREGKLKWIHKDELLTSGHKLVDDLHYIWKDVVAGTHQFFMNVEVGGPELKIIKQSTNRVKR